MLPFALVSRFAGFPPASVSAECFRCRGGLDSRQRARRLAGCAEQLLRSGQLEAADWVFLEAATMRNGR